MTILIFIIILFVLVLAHEWGHFIVAKKAGMRVDEFGIGFPPRLTSVKWRGTRYSINLLPLGGFVKIYGEDGDLDSGGQPSPSPDEPPVASNSTKDKGCFSDKTKLQQAMVLVAGVTMNVVLAWFIFFIILMIGQPVSVTEAEAELSGTAELVISEVMPDTPAATAGLPFGATVVGLSSGVTEETTLLPSTFRDFTASHNGQEVTIDYEFGGELKSVTIVPTTGLISEEPSRSIVGITLVLIETIKTPFYTAWYEALIVTKDGLFLVAVGLASFLSDLVIGQADYAQISGPVGIVGLVGDASSFGFTSLLSLTAYLSLSLAVINLLPFPALDGGRLVLVGVEAITRKSINPKLVKYINHTGFVLLLIMMVLITYNDIYKLL